MKNNTHHFIDLLLIMTEKELKARYKNTIFGFLWLFVNPLLQMLIIGFVFTFFMKEPIKNYNYYLFTNLLVWNFFSTSLSKATPSIVFERSLIKKAKFPHTIIPISIILSNLVHLLAALSLFMIPVIFIKTLSISRIPYLIPAFILLISFTVGLSLLTSALNVRFRDVAFFIQALLIIWFYATPIVYSFYIIPYQYIWLWRLNPMTSVLQLFQHAFINYPLPGVAMITVNTFMIIIISVLGILIFKKESKNFDDWL
ncbi:MAG: Polysaccharide ABC transporter permease [Candidatus Curtissbacteria bacterium GW2011_GWA1_40_16]|uniref:Transport permease protein n=1 Tax=Candidatus Curtissbacteria bacterium GW2011_GWA1_40_16 TaxID=1618405 RepID=A0A0G0UGU3_9BACT|nr:MAG: Polysaccharide ABC transporter permease [Candidatus Curtissbacteria bacterium GW2011_GWA1_40_16]